MSRVHVTIDKLVLRGGEPDQRQTLVEALQNELSRALGDSAMRAAWARSQHMPVMRLGSMPLEPGRSGSRKLGAGIARAISGGLKR
jgi:hypothetical protein